MMSRRVILSALFGFLFSIGLGSSGALAAELRVGHSSLPKPLGNPLSDTSHSGGFNFLTVYDQLTYVGSDGPGAGLAVSWRNTSPTTWEFKLRPGVKFHDGKAFEASDIADLINWLNTDEGAAKGRSTLSNTRNIKSARAIDATTVELTTKRPDPLVPATVGIIRVLNMKHFADVGNDGYGRAPIGTGPFKAEKWTGDRIDLVAFKDGWRPPKLDRITIRSLPELASRVQAFQSDQIDLAFGLVADSRAAVESAGGKLHVSSEPRVLLLMAFQNDPAHAVNDLRVRKALNYAVNKEAYIETIMGGLTVAAGQPGAKGVTGYDPSIKPYPYDLDRAKALLSEAGHGSGLKLVAEVVANVSEMRDVYQQVSVDVARIGVDLEVREITLPDLIARLRDTSKFGEATMFSFGFNSTPTMDIMRSINAQHSCKSFTKWICFPEIEETIAAANSEFDPAKRRELLAKIAAFYHDQVPGIYLHEPVLVDAVKNRVKNYNPVNYVINWHEVTM
jgi:peptide/nickel transport system substrate-binding protein